jgi:GNAT superfamily N-acetyltransferase
MVACEHSPCELLEWDSHHFGLRIGQVRGNHLSSNTIASINRWRRTHRIDCLYLLAGIDRLDTIRTAEKAGFGFTDLRVTLSRPLTLATPYERQPGVRLFDVGDLATLKQMARELHHDSRFYVDPRFPRDRSRELFALWIEKACLDSTYRVFVAVMDGRAAGYLACQRLPEDVGHIRLLGVDASAQKKGFGAQLIQAALAWLTAENVTRVSVITQGRNVPAQRLYHKCGFAASSVELWYHWWPAQHGD